jgi:spermidine synthase
MNKSDKIGSARLTRWRNAQDTSVELSEQDGIRSLHLGSDLVQSAMRISQPYDLQIAYTQCMMGFLLFNPVPKNILMIGLGGGSLAKFVYHWLPGTSMIAIEINSQVIAAARSFFFLPAEDERFRIVLADGAAYVALHPDSCDVLLIDGYEDGAMAATLRSQMFYEHALAALRPSGIMVMNFLGRDRQLNDYLDRIRACFPGGLLRLNDCNHGNVIVFAFQRRLNRRRLKTLEKRALELESQLGLPFTRYAKDFEF